MKKLFFILLVLFVTNKSTHAQTLYFPPNIGNTWDTIAPSSLNWCQDSIDALYQYLDTSLTDAFIVLKDGKIVLEKYFGNFTADSLHIWYSAGKSLKATLVGIAQKDGLLNINDKTSDYLGTGFTSLTIPQEDNITIWHQLTMTTGLDETNFSCTSPGCLTYVADAGTRWAYHNSPYNLLTDVIETVSGQGITTYTNQKIKNKIGMNSGFWLPFGDNSFYFSKARDMARFGLLTLNKGMWGSTVVLDDSLYYYQMLNSSQSINPSYGYLWWLNGKSSFIAPGSTTSYPFSIAPNSPADMFSAAGSQGQYISVSPSQNMVVIRQGESNSNDLASLSLLDNIWYKLLHMSCGTTSINSFDNENINIYPNPAKNIVYIKGLEQKKGSIKLTLTDVTGKTIKTANNQFELQLNNLQQGIYFLTITGENYKKVEKIVLQ
ncbi:MAG: serine hydrolase [Flavobacteriales bacterium]